MGLHAADGAEHQHRAVQHAQAALDFDGEIDVAGRVDQVDRGVAPFDLRGGAGDGDAALLLQVHVVHGGAAAAAMHLLHAVDAAGIEQDPLAERGLARVDVGRNADVSQFCQIHNPSLTQGTRGRDQGAEWLTTSLRSVLGSPRAGPVRQSPQKMASPAV